MAPLRVNPGSAACAALSLFMDRSTTSAWLPQRYLRSVAREIEFYQVLRLFFTGDFAAKAQNQAGPMMENNHYVGKSNLKIRF